MMKIAEIIRLSWQTYISKFKKYLLPLVYLFVISSIGSALTYLFAEVIPVSQLVAFIISLVISLVIYVLTFAVTILLVVYSDNFLNNKKPKFALKDLLPIFWPALWVTTLVGLITAAGFILLIVPGILFTVWFAFSMYLIILDKQRGLKTLSQSRELSRGRFWPVFGRLVVPNIFWGLISYLVLAGIFNLAGLIMNQAVNSVGQLSTTLNLVMIGLSNLVGAFFAPLYLIVTVIVYREVRK